MGQRYQHFRALKGPRGGRRLACVALTMMIVLVLGTTSSYGVATARTLYDDGLATGWQNCSWDSSVDFAATNPVESGTYAIHMALTAPRGGLCLMAEQALDTTPFTSLRFAARAAESGQQYQVFLYDGNGQALTYVWLANAGGNPTVSSWTSYTLPLTALGAAGRSIKGVAVQATGSGGQDTLYLDEIAFINQAAATPTAPDTSAQTDRHDIYGDGLASGWHSCSWDSSVDFAATNPVESGTYAIHMTHTAPRAGLCLMADQALDTTPYISLRFAARTAESGRQYQIFLFDANRRPLTYLWLTTFGGDPVADRWQTYTIPLTKLGAAARQVTGMAVQSIDGTSGDRLYVDGLAFVADSPAPSGQTGTLSPVALGAYIAGGPGDPSKLDEYTNLTGATPSIVMWYQDWVNDWVREFDSTRMDAVTSRGAMPMVTWGPWNHYEGAQQPAFALRTIIAGNHDAYIRRWARSAAVWGQPMYLRFAHEMNGNWYPWSPGINGNTSAEYVAAWRYVHDIFRQEGATNVRWVWSPNVIINQSLPVQPMYPGDAYVDWVGLDGYNLGTTSEWHAWESLVDVFAYSYDVLTALTDKPVMIAETASTEVGGDKASWISRGLLTDVPARFPEVRAVIWFHENKETDWRVNSSESALAAFRQAIASPLYQGRLP